MMKLYVVLFFCSFACTQALKPTDYTDCGSTGTIHSISVVGCTATPCTLIQGSVAAIEIVFTPKTPLDAVEVLVFGTIAGNDVPFRGISRKGCDSITPACPLTDVTKQYTYKANVQVKSSYPPMALDVKFKLGTDAICVKFPAQIKSKTAA